MIQALFDPGDGALNTKSPGNVTGSDETGTANALQMAGGEVE